MVLFPKFLEWRISGDNELYPRGSSNNQLPDELNVVQLTCHLSIRMCRSIVSCTNEMKVLQQYLPVMQYVFQFVCLFVCLFVYKIEFASFLEFWFWTFLRLKVLSYKETSNKCRPNEVQIGEDGDGEDLTSILICFKGSGPPPDQAQLTLQLMTISPALYGVVCAVTILCIILAVCFLAFNIKLRNYRWRIVLILYAA